MKKGYRLFLIASCALSLLSSCSNKRLEKTEQQNTTTERTKPEPPPGDHISQGLWWLYQLQYDQSRKSFSDYIHSHPQDPLGYFYKTAADWWQLAQDLALEQPEIVTQFEKDYRNTVRVAQASYKSPEP